MHPLDNIIWQALTTRQSEFAQSSNVARRFIPEVGPLAGVYEISDAAYDSLARLVPMQGTIALFLEEPFQDRLGWDLVGGAPLLEMVYAGETLLQPSQAGSTEKISELGPRDIDEMLELAELTKPGPFHRRTHELGHFFGIRRAGRLVAMSGERMKVPGFTEVSAVCTHPDHTGHGYAVTLMTEVMRGILARGETPFLHVREDNLRAIALYQRMGFQSRTRLHYVVLRKVRQ
jgi:ribosomal protein S18 acetylase RimI-like enzyme